MQNRAKIAALPVIYENAGPMERDLYLPGAEGYDLHIFDVTYLHYHSMIELGYCVSGCGECYAGDEIFPFSAGDSQIVFPYQRHYSRSLPGQLSRWHFLNLDLETLLPALGFFDTARVTAWLQQEMAVYGIFSPTRYPRIHAITCRFLAEIQGENPQKPRHRELCGALLCELLCELSRESESLPKLALGRTPVWRPIAPALEQIQEALGRGEQPTVAALSVACSMSEANFRRVFRHATGTSPKEYILCTAIHRAEQLLLQTNEEIVTISAAVGFADVSGLNRQFRRIHGVSPSGFRRRLGH